MYLGTENKINPYNTALKFIKNKDFTNALNYLKLIDTLSINYNEGRFAIGMIYFKQQNISMSKTNFKIILKTPNASKKIKQKARQMLNTIDKRFYKFYY